MNSIAWILSKLRFPLAVALGGTGKDTTAGLLTDLKAAGAYAKDNVVGAVSQASGVPTGAIIERGSNANGNYVKYADGTLYCEHIFLRNPFAVTSGIGSLFYAYSGIWTYPVAFVGATPFSLCMPIANGQLIWGTNRAISQTNAQVEFTILSVVSYTQDTTLIMRAWGRWY